MTSHAIRDYVKTEIIVNGEVIFIGIPFQPYVSKASCFQFQFLSLMLLVRPCVFLLLGSQRINLVCEHFQISDHILSPLESMVRVLC